MENPWDGRKKENMNIACDGIAYEPGKLKVIAYKNGEEWATDVVKTAGDAAF